MGPRSRRPAARCGISKLLFLVTVTQFEHIWHPRADLSGHKFSTWSTLGDQTRWFLLTVTHFQESTVSAVGDKTVAREPTLNHFWNSHALKLSASADLKHRSGQSISPHCSAERRVARHARNSGLSPGDCSGRSPTNRISHGSLLNRAIQ